MPRNGSGIYTLPAGNPVVTGTTISSTVQNNTMADVATALTQSISADGQTTVTADLPMGGHKLKGLSAGISPGDSLRWEQLFSQGIEASLASAATTDIGALNTCFVNITGTVNIENFGANFNGPRYLRFASGLTLKNSAQLVLPGAADLAVSAGDCVIAYPISGNAWKVIASSRTGVNGSIVGSMRNAKMSISAASSSASFSADQLVVKTALSGASYVLSNLNLSVNLTTVGAGGMDTGAPPANGFVALYAIYNPTSGVSALLARNATSAVQPEVYGGSNMPDGYTASSLVSVWPTDPTGKLKVGYQEDRNISFPQLQVLSTTSFIGSLTALPVGGVVPRNAVRCSGFMSAAATSGSGGVGVNVASDSNGSKLQPLNGYASGSGGPSASFHDLPLKTAQTFYYSTSAAGPTAYAFNISVNGYSI